MTAHPITTADGLGRLYSELLKAGIPQDLATDIVRDAAHSTILEGGFYVANEEQVAA